MSLNLALPDGTIAAQPTRIQNADQGAHTQHRYLPVPADSHRLGTLEARWHILYAIFAGPLVLIPPQQKCES